MTPETFIKRTLEVQPEQVRHKEFPDQYMGLRVVDPLRLKRYAEQDLGTALSWEDWLECKYRWCSKHMAYDTVVVDRRAIDYYATVALAHGYQYLLVEYLPNWSRHA